MKKAYVKISDSESWPSRNPFTSEFMLPTRLFNAKPSEISSPIDSFTPNLHDLLFPQAISQFGTLNFLEEAV